MAGYAMAVVGGPCLGMFIYYLNLMCQSLSIRFE